jgi:hypothetical protein
MKLTASEMEVSSVSYEQIRMEKKNHPSFQKKHSIFAKRLLL